MSPVHYGPAVETVSTVWQLLGRGLQARCVDLCLLTDKTIFTGHYHTEAPKQKINETFLVV